MKNSANSNIYGYAQDATWHGFAAYLEGSREALVCVVSAEALGPVARDALEKSFEKLEYGTAPCAFAVIRPDASAPAVPGLNASDLFALLEGLDPLVVVATDADAAELLAAAYRVRAEYGGTVDLLGRRAVFFRRFESLLATSEDKQRAWALLKKLKR